MPKPKGARGEGFLEIQDEDGEVLERVVLLYTNQALADGERATGRTMLQLLQSAQREDMGVGDVAQLLLVGMEAARRETRSSGHGYSIRDAYRVLDALGFTQVAAVVYSAIAEAFAYDPRTQRPNPPAATANEVR